MTQDMNNEIMTQFLGKKTTLRLVISLLLMMIVGVGQMYGQTTTYYVFKYNGVFLAHNGYNGDGSEMCAESVFSPEKCLWVYTDEGDSKKYLKTYEGNYWLHYNRVEDTEYNYTYTLLLKNTKQDNGWYSVDADGIIRYLKPSATYAETNWPAYYVCYNNNLATGWELIQKPEATDIRKALGSVVTITEVPASPILTIDCPSTIDMNGAKPTVTCTRSSKAYKNYNFDSMNHYWYDGGLHEVSPDISDVELSDNITWSLAPADAAYASVNASTGEITVKKQIQTDVTLTLTCTATPIGSSQQITNSVEITLKGGYYVLKDGDGKFLQKSGNSLGRSATFNADNGVWASYPNGTGTAFGVVSGSTTYYLGEGGPWSGEPSQPSTANIFATTPAYNHRWSIDENGYLKSARNNYFYWDATNNKWSLTQTATESCVKAYLITSIEKGDATDVTGDIKEDYGIITVKTKTYKFSATPDIRDTYYTEYTIGSEKHYWYEGAEHSGQPETWGEGITADDLTYTWSVSTNSYATVSSTGGVLTINSLPETDTETGQAGRETIILTCTISHGTGEAQKTFIIRKKLILGEEETEIHNLSGITDDHGKYRLASDFSTTGTPSVGSSSDNPFKGTIDGGLVPITGTWNRPLFDYVEDATIKNVIIEKASITTSGVVGAIAGTAQGASRIYNCGVLGDITKTDEGETYSSTIGGASSTIVGSIVGSLEGTSRVINCFSFAKITGGTEKGGIVGKNTVASKQGNIATMVMNCMFYGDISSGGIIAPVYGGLNINNLNNGKTDGTSGLNTFNYYRYESNFSKKGWITNAGDNNRKYNCALAIEERFLTRFEIYRLLLNSNKKLAARYASTPGPDGTNTTFTPNVTPEEMAKWVLETADRSITNPKPYPVLKHQGYYPSIINIDAEHAHAEAERNKGGFLGTLSVTISAPTGWTNKPDGAKLLDKNGDGIETSRTIILNRTDKDSDRFNFNYDKVQLPYYNDYGTKNYTDNRVVTGWKITNINGGTSGTYTASDSWGGYNFADRNCTNKDLYGTGGSNRVFSQGAYFDVPYGVTSITIEPYWAKAAYISDANYDVVYNGSAPYGKQEVTQLGTQCTSGSSTFNDDTNQKIYTTVSAAMDNISDKGTTVYDNAIVLVGNFHQNIIKDKAPFNGSTAFTLMSVDMDNDHEPDYSLIYHDNDRNKVCPIRFDFLNIPGTAQAQKPNGTETVLNASVFDPTKWFEITNTCNIYFSQFEYQYKNKNKNAEPVILLGGVYDQFTSTKDQLVDKTLYLHVGGNAWFKEFNNGTHSDGTNKTKHIPISVTGGEYNGFYLTGTYNPSAAVYTDDAECYISGGHFKEAAGAGQEKINGNVQWQIYDADIDNFYGGGINTSNPIQGNITVDIFNSHVGTYCGGPKFGNMVGVDTEVTTDDKKVTTNASGCVFNKFFGAGFGGTAISRIKYRDESKKSNNLNFTSWQDLFSGTSGDRGKYYDGVSTIAQSGKTYGYKGLGVAIDFDYEFFVWTSGTYGGRLFVKFASFSLAKCNNVESNLTDCTINENFYGGGSLGAVTGTAKSVLDGCTVKGNVYGAGYSASLPSLEVREAGFKKNEDNTYKIPVFNKFSGMFEPGEVTGVKSGVWKNTSDAPASFASNLTNGKLTNGKSGSDLSGEVKIIYTDEELEGLGQVNTTDLTIKGSTIVEGSVYGGGEESNVSGNTAVKLQENAHVLGSIYGGGKGKADNFKCDKAMIGIVDTGLADDGQTTKEGGTTVTIDNGTVDGNVYGGGEVGRVEQNTSVTIGSESGSSAPVINGDVFGAGKGVATHGYSALVRGDSEVTIQSDAKVLGNVYGGGEIASVGRFKVKLKHQPRVPADAPDDVPVGMPYAKIAGGNSSVTIRGNAEIGPDDMKMITASGYPDDAGHVFGGGKGILPYEDANEVYSYVDKNHRPKRMVLYDQDDHPGDGTGDDWSYIVGDTEHTSIWEYFVDEAAYIKFIETLALVNDTEVTIDGNAFVKGSVYGGSMNGHVREDTHVTIAGGQIGCGKNTTKRYPDAVWADDYIGAEDLECASWEFTGNHHPFDIYDYQADGKTPKPALDGHTFYGNVFGGGSGYYPYRRSSSQLDGINAWVKNEGRSATEGMSVDVNGYSDGRWLRSAGAVYGNTKVDITGGHILTSVYGGNEQTDVGKYNEDANGVRTLESGGQCIINMTGGSVGVPRTEKQMKDHPVTCYVFGAGKGDQRINFNKWTNVASTQVNISGTARVYGSTFGGGEDGHVLGNVETNIGGTVTIGTTSYTHENVIIGTTGTSGADGNIFGGGRGFSQTALTAGVVQGNVNVNIYGGIMKGSVFGGGRLASVGTYLVDASDTEHYGKMMEDEEGKPHGHISVSISGGTIGATDTDGKLVYSTSSIGEVFGGSKGTTATSEPFGLAKSTTVVIAENDPTNNPTVINNSVYGGGEAGSVERDVSVSIQGGTVKYDVYGGGALAHTNIKNWDAAATQGAWSAQKDPGNWADPTKTSSLYTTSISLTGGKVRDVYGGALGDANTPAYVYGDTKVHLNGVKSDTPDEEGNDVYSVITTKGCIVDRIFGCNNVNGTPKGKSLVYVHATQSRDKGETTYATVTNKPAVNADPSAENAVYDVQAIYGGGNMAAYEPVLATATTASEKEKAYTDVIIDGCHLTSIKQVYGGGNAASTPATKVTVNGTHEIFELFGGGNGFDLVSYDGGATYKENPGANVGFYDYSKDEDKEWCDEKEERVDPDNVQFAPYIYGSGVATLNVFGGLIHRVFGGSNTKGNVRQTALTLLEDAAGCEFCVDEAYGGGKSAPMDAEAILHMACIPGLKEAYGGAEAADIQGSVTLNITNGTFGRVFGGNNLSGTIRGSIKVNIEETGCKPIIIGELYGGGNQAGYSKYGYIEKTVTITDENNQDKQVKKWMPLGADPNDDLPDDPLFDDPEVNIKSFTSIGEVYGGGFGESAVMVGSPHVNINVTADGDSDAQNYYKVTFDDDENESTAEVPVYVSNYEEETIKIDEGKPTEHTVTRPSHRKGEVGAINNVFGGGNAAKVVGDTYVNIGTQEYVVFETPAKKTIHNTETGKDEEVPTTVSERTKPVIGADIRGNVYGGGNAADVTGKTNVVIGKETITTP